jgi:hypothetical protein
LREWASEPVVGFCGLAGLRTSWADKAKLALYHTRMLATQRWPDVSPYKGENLRAHALEILAQAPGLRTNFAIRDHGVFFRDADPRDLVTVRLEYAQNLAASDYVLCCRGSGNYSYRLYETLCMGRIPIFINTDCILPAESAIDWRRSCVWVDESELGICRTGCGISSCAQPRGVSQPPAAQRDVWLRQIAPSGFFANLHWTLAR